MTRGIVKNAAPAASADTALLETMALVRARAIAAPLFATMVLWVSYTVGATDVWRWQISFASTLCALVGALAIALARDAIPTRCGHMVCAVLWWSPIASTLAASWAQPDLLYSLLVTIEMLVGAVILLDTRWTTGTLLATLATWLLLSVREPPHVQLVYGLTGITTTAFAIIMQRILKNATLRQAATNSSLALQLAERTRLEAQLFHSQRMEAVGTLSAGLAHDMNNVLASIANFAELLRDELHTDRAHADLGQIVAQARRGAELTRGLLAFSRRGQYSKRLIQFDQVVRDAAAMLTRTLPRTIELRCELGCAGARVNGDPTQLGQVIINLCLNAADAMDAVGVLSVTTRLVDLERPDGIANALPGGRYVQVDVRDTGAGMDDATKARLFEPFFTTKAPGKGTGLGLSSVWGVVQSHDGGVSVESAPGRGALFIVQLPLSDTSSLAPLPPVAAAAPIVAAPRVSAQRTVLVVDDEAPVRIALSRILQKAGIAVLQAANGDEALRLAGDPAVTVDLVILDMGMPVMDGAECFRRLRETSAVPVIVATGYAADRDLQAMVARGAILVEKPYEPAELLAEIRRVLGCARPSAGSGAGGERVDDPAERSRRAGS